MAFLLVARTPPFSVSRDHCTLLTDIKVSFATTDVITAQIGKNCGMAEANVKQCTTISMEKALSIVWDVIR